jgi:hypothetical protein
MILGTLGYLSPEQVIEAGRLPSTSSRWARSRARIGERPFDRATAPSRHRVIREGRTAARARRCRRSSADRRALPRQDPNDAGRLDARLARTADLGDRP